MKLFDIIKENESDLGEVSTTRNLFLNLAKAGTGLKSTHKAAINAVLNFDVKNMIFSGTKKTGTTPIKNADDFLKAVKAGTVGATDLGKVYSGLFKNSTTQRDFLKILVPDLIDDATFIRKYSKYSDDATLRSELKKAQYSDNALKEIMAQVKANKSGKFNLKRIDGGVTGGGKKTPPIPPKANKSLGERIRELRNIKSWPLAVKWAAGLGIGAAALWAFSDSNNILFPDMPETQPEDSGEWSECVQKLIKSGEGVLETDTDGRSGVKFKNDTYPDGIVFYSDGTVKNLSTNKIGTWKCKDGVISEIKIITLIKSVLNEVKLQEQIDDELSDDVETMIDLLDFPVSQSDLINAGALLKKYVDNGKGKSFLTLYQNSGLASGDLRKSVKYIYTSAPKSVQSKQYLNSLITQIEGGSSTTTPDEGNRGLDGIEITFPDNQDNVTIIPPKRQFFDCNDKPLPHEFGCKSEQIRKLQKCLGDVKADSAFGGLTKGSLEKRNIDTSNGITQGIIDTVCGTSNTTDTSTGIRLKPGDIPIPERFKYNVQSSNVNFNLPNIKASEVTDGTFYNTLKDNGNIVGLEGNTRIKYKGPDLDEVQLGKLDNVIIGMGYTRIKNLEELKPYGSKYVWTK